MFSLSFDGFTTGPFADFFRDLELSWVVATFMLATPNLFVIKFEEHAVHPIF